ncbi:Fur family transcriptional regulator, ferric uptake regulator [Raineyella antarctica]|uniref:Fur family transcriptional regulator, ferric uptake regulator n=1 Tax=Raineyella antarctica TaxID=1577474 RepID=A0A1G6GWS5_9ACTN|nr:Fur family transcriptional regulator [Raineyella antarctica]SDB86500.1 Fur family transcriptional regulator, ferric uptake regulator [Raineyella antarctica]
MAVGQRTTRQREAVDRVMAQSEEFRTAQQVHELLRARGDQVGLTTVYRTLQAMADAGEVDVLRTGDGEAAYRRCTSEQHHHHLVCTGCGRTVEIEDPDVHAWTQRIGAQHGFHDVRHDLEIYGVCEECWARG